MVSNDEFQKVARFIKQLSDAILSVRKGDFYKDQFELLLVNYRDDVLDDTFKSGGSNINNLFKSKKPSSLWKERRKYNALMPDTPGIWSGETYRALKDGSNVGNRISIFKKVSKNQFMYGYKAKYKSKDITKHINVNLGLPDNFIERETERITDALYKIIDKKINHI